MAAAAPGAEVPLVMTIAARTGNRLKALPARNYSLLG
jgi:hypothetical protein